MGLHGRMGLGERIGEHLWKGEGNRSRGCMTEATTNAGSSSLCWTVDKLILDHTLLTGAFYQFSSALHSAANLAQVMITT